LSQPAARPQLAIAVGLAVVAMGAGFFIALGKSSSEPPPVVAQPTANAAAPVPLPAPAPAISNLRVKPASDAPTKPASKLDREASDRMRAQIQRSLDQPSGSPAPRSADPAGAGKDGEQADAPPVLDANYVRERIKEDLVPVAIECYESALADDPTLAGTLVVNFTILGDPEVGGVVDDATIADEGSTLANEFVRECIRESMMAVQFDAPPEGGRVEVTYPIKFAPEEPDDDGD
jgi:hypothetical protein